MSIPIRSPLFDGSGAPGGPAAMQSLGNLSRPWFGYLSSLGPALNGGLSSTATGMGVNTGSGLKTTSNVVALNYGAGLADDGSGAATILAEGPLYLDISNKLNLLYNATNFSLVGGGPPYTFTVNEISVANLIAGTALFTGTAVFAYTSTGPFVEVGSAGAIFGDNLAAPVATVTIASGGATMAVAAPAYAAGTTYAIAATVIYTDGVTYYSLIASNTGNTPSSWATRWQPINPAYASGTTYGQGARVLSSGVTYVSLQAANTGNTPASSPTWWTPALVAGLSLTAPGVGIYGPSGSLTQTSGGIVIANNNVSAAITAGQIQLLYTGGNSVTLSNSGLVITNGQTGGSLAAITIGSSSFVLENNTGSSVTLNSSGVTIVGGILTAPGITGGAITGTSITLTGGSFTVNLDTTNGVLVTNGTSSVSLSGGYCFVTGPGPIYGSYTYDYFLVGTASVYVQGNASGTPFFSVVQAPGIYSTLYSTSLVVNGLTLLNGSGQFVGRGVFCPSYGIQGSYGYFGGNTSDDGSGSSLQVKDQTNGTFSGVVATYTVTGQTGNLSSTALKTPSGGHFPAGLYSIFGYVTSTVTGPPIYANVSWTDDGGNSYSSQTFATSNGTGSLIVLYLNGTTDPTITTSNSSGTYNLRVALVKLM